MKICFESCYGSLSVATSQEEISVLKLRTCWRSKPVIYCCEFFEARWLKIVGGRLMPLLKSMEVEWFLAILDVTVGDCIIPRTFLTLSMSMEFERKCMQIFSYLWMVRLLYEPKLVVWVMIVAYLMNLDWCGIWSLWLIVDTLEKKYMLRFSFLKRFSSLWTAAKWNCDYIAREYCRCTPIFWRVLQRWHCLHCGLKCWSLELRIDLLIHLLLQAILFCQCWSLIAVTTRLLTSSTRLWSMLLKLRPWRLRWQEGCVLISWRKPAFFWPATCSFALVRDFFLLVWKPLKSYLKLVL